LPGALIGDGASARPLYASCGRWTNACKGISESIPSACSFLAKSEPHPTTLFGHRGPADALQSHYCDLLRDCSVLVRNPRQG
jgi:hypothetical protein